MIFTLSESVKDGDLRCLSRAILLISEKHHHLLMDDDVKDWLTATILNTTDYLGKLDCEALKNNRELWCVTQMQQQFQSHVSVSNNEEGINIKQLFAIVNEPSYVILENSLYDWSAICRWVEIYKTERNYKNLNESLHRAIIENNLRTYHAGGGNGSIVNQIETIKGLYLNQAYRKITTIYDSDKKCKDDSENHNKSLNKYLKDFGFIGHELHKREIENYFSIDTMRAAGLINENADIPNFTPEEYDFVDIENATFTKYKKRFLPNLAKQLYRDSLKQRVAHHRISDSVDEIQFIIFLLAKYI